MSHERMQHHHKSVQAHSVRSMRFRASLTVECALVLPLFFLFCVTLISFMSALKLQVTENLALSNKARRLAISASALDESPAPWITLCQPKHFSYPVTLPGIAPLKIACFARVHVWDGSPLSNASASEQSEDDEMVFVTEHESVYHTHSDCSHINLTIYKSSTDEISSLRNADGRRYRKCRGFPKDYTGAVYVSKTGDYYYPSTDYAALTRHVRCISKREAGALHECSRCRALDEQEAYSDAA